MACGTLVSWSRIEPILPAMEAQSVNHWISREVPLSLFLFCFVLFLITYLVVPGQLAQHCGPRGQEVLNRENNQKLGKETWF